MGYTAWGHKELARLSSLAHRHMHTLRSHKDLSKEIKEPLQSLSTPRGNNIMGDTLTGIL